VIATRVGGIPEVVVDGETGLLVPPRDPEALAAAIVRLVKDRNLRAKMGAAGLARVHSAFSAEQMVKNTLRVYQRVAHSRTAASAQSEDSRPAT
jgi:glycosyltransferase involved in cell wall biosynthesis